MITGHTGFKGSWLSTLLNLQGLRAVGYSLEPQTGSLFDTGSFGGRIPEHFGDLRDKANLEAFFQTYKPSAVIHLAAKSLVLQSYESPRETFDVNVMGTVNVLEAAFNTKSVEAVVVVTSDKVYRNEENEESYSESHPLQGRDPYSASKVATEAVVSCWQHLAAIGSGPKLVAVRAGNVIGGGDSAASRLLPDIVKGFRNRNKVVIRNPSATRPWQHVLDPIYGYLQTLDFVLAGGKINALNFGPSESPISVREVATCAREIWGNQVELEFYGESTPGHLESKYLNIDSSQATRLLGWQSTWNQRESISRTIHWWKNVLENGANPTEATLHDITDYLSDLEKF